MSESWKPFIITWNYTATDNKIQEEFPWPLGLETLKKWQKLEKKVKLLKKKFAFFCLEYQKK